MTLSVSTTSPIANVSASALATLAALGQASGSKAVKTGPSPASTAQADPAGSASSSTPSDGLQAVSAGLSRTISVIDAGVAAGRSVADLLAQIRDQASAASDPSLQSSARSSLNSAFSTTLLQIAPVIDSASVDGANLIDGSSSGLKAATDTDGAIVAVAAQALAPGGAIVTLSPDASIATATAAAQVLDQAQTSIANVSAALTRLSAQGDQISAHGALISTLNAPATSSSATLAGDPADDDVRLQALALQQALRTQSGGVANAAPQALLALFRS